MSTLVAGPGVSASRREFIVAFYAASDKRDVPAYLEFLAPDVDFRMGLSAMRGHASVAAFRDGMWKGVATRSHTPRQVYSAGPDEVMLYGEVGYGLENGAAVSVPFAARLSFTADKLGLYQVWLDPTNLKAAMTK